MVEQGRLSRAMALATLASALAWGLPALAVEADTETEAAPSTEPVYHTLEPGETLTEIADRYGTSIASLIRENEIDSSTAASLIHDIGFAHSISKKLLSSAITLWVRDKEIKELEESYEYQ